jgi:mxaJ protein
MRFKLLFCALLAAGIALAAGRANAADANVLRVCADPNYLPYSNQAGQGFENKVAAIVAKALGDKLEYHWDSERGHGGFDQFLHDTLNAHKCDVVMDVPYGSQEVLTTDYYYISSYVFVFPKKKDYDISSMDSPVLRKLQIGFESDTPPEDGLKLRDLVGRAVAFNVADLNGTSPAVMLRAVQDGSVDVMITWEPAIGYFLKNYPGLEVVPVPNERATGSPEQYAFPMAMGVRKDDQPLADRLSKVIASHKGELTAALNSFGVKLYTPRLGVAGLYQ